jgi:hypothetical protein
MLPYKAKLSCRLTACDLSSNNGRKTFIKRISEEIDGLAHPVKAVALSIAQLVRGLQFVRNLNV